MLLASALIVAGVVLTGFSIVQIRAQSSQLAQATQPLQSSPPTAPNNTPAESKPGGERPTTPAPEPARPDAQAQKDYLAQVAEQQTDQANKGLSY